MQTGVGVWGRGRVKVWIKVWARPCPSWASRDELLPGLCPACFAGLLAPTSVLQVGAGVLPSLMLTLLPPRPRAQPHRAHLGDPGYFPCSSWLVSNLHPHPTLLGIRPWVLCGVTTPPPAATECESVTAGVQPKASS